MVDQVPMQLSLGKEKAYNMKEFIEQRIKSCGDEGETLLAEAQQLNQQAQTINDRQSQIRVRLMELRVEITFGEELLSQFDSPSLETDLLIDGEDHVDS